MKTVVLCASLVSVSIYAKTDIELFTGVQRMNLKAKEKHLTESDKDHSTAASFGLGVYKSVSEQSAWGLVIEVSTPVNRDKLKGSGRILGIRPVNWRYKWTDQFSTDVFLGAARYSWEKEAIGYYLGTSASYKPAFSPLNYQVELKYFKDLTYDTQNGDLFVNGPALGFKIGYQF